MLLRSSRKLSLILSNFDQKQIVSTNSSRNTNKNLKNIRPVWTGKCPSYRQRGGYTWL